MDWNATQIALIREAAIAGNSLSAGLSGMRKANYAKLGLYGESIFTLALGLERLLKIIVILDGLIIADRFPTDRELKAYGQDIEDLFGRARDIRTKHKVRAESSVEDGSIEHDLFRFITRFSVSTMYFNLDFFNGADKGATRVGHSRDPVSQWFDGVAKRVLDEHLPPKRRQKLGTTFGRVDTLADNLSMVGFVFEESEDPAAAASIQAELNGVLQKYVPFYAARLCRYLHETLLVLTREAQAQARSVEVPNLEGLFFPFEQDDAALLNRKTFPPRA